MEPKITEVSDSHLQGEDYIFKIVIVGDSGVGKSNILSRFTLNEFHNDSKATVGVELQTKLYSINGKIIKIQLWDTAGQERYKSITSAYFKGSKGAMIVYDITKQESFDSVDKWYQQVKEFGDDEVVIIQVGNKCDLKQNRKVDIEHAKERAKQKNVFFMETSAADSTNIDSAFKTLIIAIYNKLNKKIDIIEKRNSMLTVGVKLDNNNYDEDHKEKCKC